MIIHLLTKQANTVFTTGCGIEYKAKTTELPVELTGWTHEVTCPLCATRVIVHKAIESWENLYKVVDIDNPDFAWRFHFEGKRFGFRWLTNERLVYVYNNLDDSFAMSAFPIQNFVPETLGRTPTQEDAAAAARAWVVTCSERFGDDGGPRAYQPPTRAAQVPSSRPRRQPAAPPRPIIPPGYDGPLCAGCGKHDEGDFMPDPTNMLQELCMICFVKANK